MNVPPNQQRFNPFLKDSLYIKRKSIDTPEVCQNKKENSTIPKDQPSTHPRPAQGNTSGCAGQTNVAKKDKNKNITDENKSDCRQSLSRSTDMSDKNKNAIVNNRKVDSNCNASESPQILKSDHNQLEDNTTTERMRSAKSEVAPGKIKRRKNHTNNRLNSSKRHSLPLFKFNENIEAENDNLASTFETECMEGTFFATS